MRERIITAICLLAVVIPMIVLGGFWFVGLGLIATSIAAWEMVKMHDTLMKTPLLMKGLTVINTVAIVFLTELSWVFRLVVGYMLLLMIQVMIKKIVVKTINFHFIILVYVGLAFRSLLEIRNHSLQLFLFLVIIVILTDSMAYFSGSFFGKHKLAPKISPKKTIEGAIGGWLAGAIFAIVFGLINDLFSQMWILVVLAIGLPILSQLSDLFASALKRKYGIKDYGKIFPGHGGVMDRVDSQMLAAILIYVMMIISDFG